MMPPNSSSKAVSKKHGNPFAALKTAFQKKFVLRKKEGNKGNNTRRHREEDKLRYCTGVSNFYYTCEDHLCNRYYLHDLNGERSNRVPVSGTFLELRTQQEIDARTLYLSKTRPLIDVHNASRQLLILQENESIQQMRLEASLLGGKQLARMEIRTMTDVLNVLQLEHKFGFRFSQEGIDLATLYFLTEEDLTELGLKMGERIRLQIVLEFMRRVRVESQSTVLRTTKFIKGDIVEHYSEHQNHLIRRGKIVGVHSDDVASGVYYTMAVENETDYEVQSAERKLEFPGVWQAFLLAKGITPIYKELTQEEEEEQHKQQEEQQEEQEQREHEQHEQQQEQQTEPPPPPPVVDSTLDKYMRMKRAGLPQGAIENAMERDGVSIPMNFFSSSTTTTTMTPPPLPPPSRPVVIAAAAAPPPPPPPSRFEEQNYPISTGRARMVSLDPPPPKEEEDSMEFLEMSMEEMDVLIEDRKRRQSSVTGLPPPPPAPPPSSSSSFPNSDLRKASVSELEILKAIDQQLHQDTTATTTRLRRESSAFSGLAPPPPIPSYNMANLEPMLEVEYQGRVRRKSSALSGLAPPPPVPPAGRQEERNLSLASLEPMMELYMEEEDSGMNCAPPLPPSSRQNTSSDGL